VLVSARRLLCSVPTMVVGVLAFVSAPALAARPYVFRRSTLSMLVCLIALGGVMTLTSAASAAVTHDFLSKITEIPATGPKGETVALPGSIRAPSQMTVDAGDLWVGESDEGTGDFRVDEFDDASDAFVSQLPAPVSPNPGEDITDLDNGVAVGHATGETELYVGADSAADVRGETGVKGAVAVFGAGGQLQRLWEGEDTPQGGQGEGGFGCFQCSSLTAGVAVDESTDPSDWAKGDVYVLASEHKVIDVFKPEKGGGEKYLTQIVGVSPGEPFGSALAMAVDETNGDVLVVNEPRSKELIVDVFKPVESPKYEFVRAIADSGARGGNAGTASIAVGGGEGGGDVYVALGGPTLEEFDVEGAHLGTLIGLPGEQFSEVDGVAVDPKSQDLYVGNRLPPNEGLPSNIDIFGPDLTIPDVTTGSATSLKARSVTLNGTVNPDKAGTAGCRFVWGTTASFGHEAPCEPETVAEGGSAVPVHATVTGLEPGTTYYYRLQASNEHGVNPGESTQDGQFKTPGPLLIEWSASEVTNDSATLQATIAPNGSPATYYFQYGTGAALEASAPAPLGSEEGEVSVSAQLTGLAPGAVYRFRVVAIEESGSEQVVDESREATFTTQGAGAFLLPDGRQWEMVSPPQKNGALLEPINSEIFESPAIQAAAAGDAIAYQANVPTEAAPQGASNGAEVLSVRGAEGGWTSQDLGLPHAKAVGLSIGTGEEYRLFSEDLSKAVVQPFGKFEPAVSEEASELTPLLRVDYLDGDVDDLCTPTDMHCYRPLVTASDATSGEPFGEEAQCIEGISTNCGPLFVDASPDLSHVVVSSDTPLTAGSEAGLTTGPGLYEWSSGGLKFLGNGEIGGKIGGNGVGGARHAISEDGSRVFFSDEGNLYMRDLSTEKTVQVDVPDPACLTAAERCRSVSPKPNAAFQFASPEGSRVFFTDSQRLSVGAGRVGADLYSCEIKQDVCEPQDLTPSGEIVGSIVGASEDGSWLYFVADGKLAAGAVSGSCQTERAYNEPQDMCNLYVLHDGVTKLVAVLSGFDPDWGPQLDELGARVSPNGEWLAFVSQRQLTGYNNRDARSGQRDVEVYLYNGRTSQLDCASCDPSGARPIGVEYAANSSGTVLKIPLAGDNGLFKSRTWIAANVPGWTPYSLGQALHQSRYLSNSGRLFFDSIDALAPGDVNGEEDVYEYEPEGVGPQGARCDPSADSGSEVFKPVHTAEVEGRVVEEGAGCVGLISSGSGGGESAFLDASESGGDVFFLTVAKLVPQDVDGELDVYDAHECTPEAPCPSTAETPPPCITAESCRAAPIPQPAIFGAPSSSTFSGFGNVAAESPAPSVKPKSSSRAQKLASALRRCRRARAKRKRVVCEASAHRKYGVVQKASRMSTVSRKAGR
jgi:hypothetical protein